MTALKVGLAQISPVWLDKYGTLAKIETSIKQAAQQNCDLIVFGEALFPGYPFWLHLTDGARFDHPMHKMLYAHYAQNAIDPAKDLNTIQTLAKEHQISIYLGCIEKATDRGGHSLYCSLIYIDQEGNIQSIHRKLQPTYEERLVWAAGDGNGLKTHPLKGFTLGGLNCWENWMPLPRAALYALGENVHIAVWPGSHDNTKDITRFIARESRSYVISVSSTLNSADIPTNTPYYNEIIKNCSKNIYNGGSAVASPNGEWLLEPQINTEDLFTVDLQLNTIFEERQNFDPSGHYSRPDVTQLNINTNRQSILKTN